MFTFATSSLHYNEIRGQKAAKFPIKNHVCLFMSIFFTCIALYGLRIESVYIFIHIRTEPTKINQFIYSFLWTGPTRFNYLLVFLWNLPTKESINLLGFLRSGPTRTNLSTRISTDRTY